MSAANPYKRRAAAHETQAQPPPAPVSPPAPPPAAPLPDPAQPSGDVPYPSRATYLAGQATQTEGGAQPEDPYAGQAPGEAAYSEGSYVEEVVGAGTAAQEQTVAYEEASQFPPDEPTFDPDSLGADPADSDVLAEDDPNAPTIIRTDIEGTDGLNKCPRCGSTEISLNPQTGQLRCHFCRHEWDAKSALETMGLDTPIEQLSGLVMGSGAGDIIPSTEVIVTFKCEACGAEVVIDTDHSMQARCHSSLKVLSLN